MGLSDIRRNAPKVSRNLFIVIVFSVFSQNILAYSPLPSAIQLISSNADVAIRYTHARSIAGQWIKVRVRTRGG
jgi:hypothetical protein